MRIYLDMCCYNRPYDDQAQLRVSFETQAKLLIQQRIKNRELELVGSYMLRYECGQNPYEMRKNAILDFLDHNMAAYVGAERKAIVEAKAGEIMKTGVKFKDACHVASAIYAQCAWFISTDKRLLRYRTDEIRMASPVAFIMEVDDD